MLSFSQLCYMYIDGKCNNVTGIDIAEICPITEFDYGLPQASWHWKEMLRIGIALSSGYDVRILKLRFVGWLKCCH